MISKHRKQTIKNHNDVFPVEQAPCQELALVSFPDGQQPWGATELHVSLWTRTGFIWLKECVLPLGSTHCFYTSSQINHFVPRKMAQLAHIMSCKYWPSFGFARF